MSRSATIEHAPAGEPPAIWHVWWQAALGRRFFSARPLCERIRARLLDAHCRPNRLLIDYVLLPTELHVLSGISSGERVNGIARAVGNVVSKWVRAEQPLRSPVLAGPYRARLLETRAEVLAEVRMLAWRPVILGLCNTPTYYPYGALRIANGQSPAHGFDSRPLLNIFGRTIVESRAALRACVSRRPSPLETRAWELAHGLALAAGGDGTRTGMAIEVHGAAAVFVAAGGNGVDGALRLLATWVAARIGREGTLDPQAPPNAAGARGRALVACLAVQHGLCSAASVARYFGRAKATLSEQMAACRARAADHSILATPPRRILEEAIDLGMRRADRTGGASAAAAG